MTCADHLMSDAARPGGFTFHHRSRPGLDSCNGLIGQAWSIEALAEATRVSGDARYAQLAHDVFEMHPFDERTGLWLRRDIDGSVLGADLTFNHQLWFAAAAALLPDGSVRHCIERFLDHVDDTLSVFPGGLIRHRVAASSCLKAECSPWAARPVLRWLRDISREKLETSIGPLSSDNAAFQKCIGYHAFNTYAFASLKTCFPTHAVWQTAKMRAAIAYLTSSAYEQAIEAEGTYGFGYNPPGFEVPFSVHGLCSLGSDQLIELTSHWLARQLRRTWTSDRRRPAPVVADPATATARIYEIARMPTAILNAVELHSG